MNKSEAMKMMLVGVGITIDEPRPTPSPARVAVAPVVVDRERVRAILVGAVPDHHLDWMTASAPSEQAAREYVLSRRKR